MSLGFVKVKKLGGELCNLLRVPPALCKQWIGHGAPTAAASCGRATHGKSEEQLTDLSGNKSTTDGVAT